MSYEGRIGTYTFRLLTEHISESYDLTFSTLKNLRGMYEILQNTQSNAVRGTVTDLKTQIITAYQKIILGQIINNRDIIGAIAALNSHVLSRYGAEYGYEDLDEFLVDQYLSVPLTYATLSDLAGFNIQVIGDQKATFSDIEHSYEEITKPYDLIGWENV